MTGHLRHAASQLAGAWPRSAAAAAAILVAVASCVVLTSTVQTQRLEVTREVSNSYRSTYDILVRPKGSADPREKADGLVRPSFLSGHYGGITLRQVEHIAALPGVDVAAPVAVLGQTMRNVLVPVDVSEALRGRDHAMVRFGLEGMARNRTSRTQNQSGYLYLTRAPLTSVDHLSGPDTASSPAQVERRGAKSFTACLASDAGTAPATPAEAFQERCWSAHPRAGSPGAARVEVLFSIPLTVQAVDPQAEARLTGLDHAVVSGRALNTHDSFATDRHGPAPIQTATAVMASQLPFDYQARITVEELSEATVERVLDSGDADVRRRLVLTARPVRTLASVERDAADTYRGDIVPNVDPAVGIADQSLMVLALNQPADVTYLGTSPLRPRVVPFNPSAWRAPDGVSDFLPAPSTLTDTAYRDVAVARKAGDRFISFTVVGTYDPDRLPRPSRLNDVPLETYRASTLVGADKSSRAALGERPMASDLSPTGYLQSAPALLVSLKSLSLFWSGFSTLNQQAPVSSVRVRVAGITGLDAVARERIRQTADRIQRETGLDVDITIGASLQNRRVHLPRTASGTPALVLNEQWTKKGVAVAITQALDVKSVVLLALILASAGLSVGLIATATVTARRRELATLSCLGWPAARVHALLATELTMLGTAAGTAGALLARPASHILGITVRAWQLALAAPLGLVLAVVSGAAAVATARRISPLDAFAGLPARTTSRRRMSLNGPASLGVILASRRPGRSALAVAAVAMAVAAGVLLAIMVRSFHGAVVGSLLGDAVALQVRGPDVAAAIILATLGTSAVASILFLGLAEDASGYAALRATGWTGWSLVRTQLTQAVVLGLAGACAGCLVAVAVSAGFLGFIPRSSPAVCAWAVGIAIVVCLAAATLPAVLVVRLPAAEILARE